MFTNNENKTLADIYTAMLEAKKQEAKANTEVEVEDDSEASDAGSTETKKSEDPAAVNTPAQKKDEEEKDSVEEASCKSKKEALDPVGKADADIDNDGDVDASDKYLHKRRKAIKKAMRESYVDRAAAREESLRAKLMEHVGSRSISEEELEVFARRLGMRVSDVKTLLKYPTEDQDAQTNVSESVELSESSTRDYVDNILPKALKKAGIDCKVSKKTGYTSYKCDGYEIVNDGVGIKVKEGGKEIAYYSKPKLDYKKAVSDVNESTQSVELEEGKKLRNVLSDREFEKSMKKALADKSNYKGGKVNWSFIDADVYMELTAKGYDLRHPSINYMDRFDKLADKLDPEMNESVELEEAKYGFSPVVAKGKKAKDYMAKRAQNRRDMNQKNDPGAAKKHLALSVLDKEKARAKAKKKGANPSEFEYATGPKPNKMTLTQKGLDTRKANTKKGLPEQTELDEAKKELTPKAVEDYLVKTGVNPNSAKEAVKKNFGYANKKYGGPTYASALKKVAEVVWTLGESTELEEAKSKIGEFDDESKANAFAKKHGGYVKPVTFKSRGNTKYYVFKEGVELEEALMKFDAQDAIGDFKKGKVAKIKSNQSVNATVMPVRGNSFDTDDGYVPVLKNFSRKGKMTKVDLKAGQEVAIDAQRGNVYGMVGDKFFYTSTGNVDLNESVELEEAKYDKFGERISGRSRASSFRKKELEYELRKEKKPKNLKKEESELEESVAETCSKINSRGMIKMDAEDVVAKLTPADMKDIARNKAQFLKTCKHKEKDVIFSMVSEIQG